MTSLVRWFIENADAEGVEAAAAAFYGLSRVDVQNARTATNTSEVGVSDGE